VPFLAVTPVTEKHRSRLCEVAETDLRFEEGQQPSIWPVDLHTLHGGQMPDLMPVNIGEATVVSRASSIAGLDPKAPPRPEVSQLASWSQENFQLDTKAAAHLGFPVAHLGAEMQRTLLIFGSSRWADTDSGDGHVYRFGVALRVLVQVTSATVKGDLTLPSIAADVQLGNAQASAQLLVRGYNSSTLGKLLPPWQSFNVDSYATYMAAISAIQGEVMAHDENIVPQLLATTIAAPSLPSSAQSVGTVTALRGIAEGRTLHSLFEEEAEAPDEVKDAIVQKYTELGLGSDDDPTSDMQKQSTMQLGILAPIHHWWNG
jgi:hypothetical protein